MKKRNEVFNKISNDLKINRFSCETESNYISRLIYSVVGCWVLFCTEDQSFTEDTSKHGSSKRYINNRCAEVLNNFLEIFPKAKDWFYGKHTYEASDVIGYIRNIYESVGFLVSAGTDTSLTLPKYKSVCVKNNLNINKGIATIGKMIGLGTYEKSNRESSLSDFFKMFLIPEKKANVWVESLIEQAQWNTKANVLEETQYFNYSSPKALSQSWQDNFPENIITVYKNSYSDYGLVKFLKGKIYTAPLYKYLIDEVEVRRVMYGLKGLYGMNMKAGIKKHKDVGILTLYSRLPEKEMRLLRLLAWPVNGLDDDYHYYIPNSTLTIVKMMLNSLCINTEEI